MVNQKMNQDQGYNLLDGPTTSFLQPSQADEKQGRRFTPRLLNQRELIPACNREKRSPNNAQENADVENVAPVEGRKNRSPKNSNDAQLMHQLRINRAEAKRNKRFGIIEMRFGKKYQATMSKLN